MNSICSSFRAKLKTLGIRGMATSEEICRKIKPRKIRSSKTEWTPQQLKILSAIEEGKSVFITGSAGTGKTVLVKQIIKRLRKIHGPKGVFVTASTGVAACALSGQTLHSFAGVGLGELGSSSLLGQVLGNGNAMGRWGKAKALVIDEISMVAGGLFEKLEYVANGVRFGDVGRVWGGIQLVVSGDFLQLPPVVGEFAFEASCWDCSFDLQVELTTVFRQSDPRQVRLLQGIRRGEIDDEGLELLKQRCCEREPNESVVRLYPRTKDVDQANEMRLYDLGEDLVTYEARDWGENPWVRQLEQGITPTRLELCKGTRVMLTKNLNAKRKLVNGSTGTVTDFVKTNLSRDEGWLFLPVVKFDSGREEVIKPESWEVIEGDKVVAKRTQIPLALAWAMSIHKSQGMSLDRLHTDLSRAFGYGMVYVALSRVKTLEGLHLSGFKPWKIKAHPKVLDFYRKFFD